MEMTFDDRFAIFLAEQASKNRPPVSYEQRARCASRPWPRHTWEPPNADQVRSQATLTAELDEIPAAMPLIELD